MKNNEGTINVKQLSVDELESVTGGSFLPNSYSVEEYRACGIMVFKFMLEPDIFYWRGEKISSYSANKIMVFIEENGCQPDSVKQAEDYISDHDYSNNRYLH